MSEEQLKVFLEQVKVDSNLQDNLKAAKTHKNVIGIAKEHWHEFTSEYMTQLN